MLLFENILKELSASEANIRWGIELERLAPDEYGDYPDAIRMSIMNMEINDWLVDEWQFKTDTSIKADRGAYDAYAKVEKKVKKPPIIDQYDQIDNKTYRINDVLDEEKQKELARLIAELLPAFLKDTETKYGTADQDDVYDELKKWCDETHGSIADSIRRSLPKMFNASLHDMTIYDTVPEIINKEFLLKYFNLVAHYLEGVLISEVNSFKIEFINFIGWTVSQEGWDHPWFNIDTPPWAFNEEIEQYVKLHEQLKPEYYQAKEEYDDAIFDARSKVPTYTGVEIVSPILSYDPGTVRDVLQILGQLKKLKFKVNDSTGLHIHVSTTRPYTNFNLVAMALWSVEHEQEFYLLFGDTRKESGYADSIQKVFWEEGGGQWLENLHDTMEGIVEGPDIDPDYHSPGYEKDWWQRKEQLLQAHIEGLIKNYSPVSRIVAQNDYELYQKYGGENMMGSITGSETRNVGLNTESLATHGTIEFRFGAGTLNQTLVKQYLLLCVEAFYRIFTNRISYEGMEVIEVVPESKYEVRYKNKSIVVDI